MSCAATRRKIRSRPMNASSNASRRATPAAPLRPCARICARRCATSARRSMPRALADATAAPGKRPDPRLSPAGNRRGAKRRQAAASGHDAGEARSTRAAGAAVRPCGSASSGRSGSRCWRFSFVSGLISPAMFQLSQVLNILQVAAFLGVIATGQTLALARRRHRSQPGRHGHPGQHPVDQHHAGRATPIRRRRSWPASRSPPLVGLAQRHHHR